MITTFLYSFIIYLPSLTLRLRIPSSRPDILQLKTCQKNIDMNNNIFFYTKKRKILIQKSARLMFANPREFRQCCPLPAAPWRGWWSAWRGPGRGGHSTESHHCLHKKKLLWILSVILKCLFFYKLLKFNEDSFD